MYAARLKIKTWKSFPKSSQLLPQVWMLSTGKCMVVCMRKWANFTAMPYLGIVYLLLFNWTVTEYDIWHVTSKTAI